MNWVDLHLKKVDLIILLVLIFFSLSRAKIQCLMCSFAGVKTSNMVRHYKDVHGYDASIADKSLDDEMPDGCLCTECGEIFINRHGLMRHLIKAHSKPGGEPCLYCPFRFVTSYLQASYKVYLAFANVNRFCMMLSLLGRPCIIQKLLT